MGTALVNFESNRKLTLMIFYIRQWKGQNYTFFYLSRGTLMHKFGFKVAFSIAFLFRKTVEAIGYFQGKKE